MKHLHVVIEGITPLLVNKFTDAAQLSATNGSTAAYKGAANPKEEAFSRLHLDEEGRPIMPQPNIFRSIMEGGRFFKAGKTKVTTQRSSLIAACLSFDDIYYPIQSKGSWAVDSRPIRNPATGGRLLRYRPVFFDWRIAFSMTLDDEIVPVPLLREIVDTAGKRIGLGDFRPDCKGPFGKFLVVEWKES